MLQHNQVVTLTLASSLTVAQCGNIHNRHSISRSAGSARAWGCLSRCDAGCPLNSGVSTMNGSSQSSINNQIVATMQEGANWGVNVSLGLASLLCVAFVVGFVIRKL